MMHSFTDLSESRLVNAYASQVVNAIRDDASAPGCMTTFTRRYSSFRRPEW
ncbi:hypothetical protein ACVZDL_05845 [Escherichia coli]